MNDPVINDLNRYLDSLEQNNKKLVDWDGEIKQSRQNNDFYGCVALSESEIKEQQAKDNEHLAKLESVIKLQQVRYSGR